MQPRILARWLLLAGLLLVAFLGTVIALNQTVYSPAGFVRSYLSALVRHDVEGALAMPGVSSPASGSDELLAPASLAALDGIHLVRDTDEGAGRHTVLYGYTIGGTKATTAFTVNRDGAHLGLFSAWRFVDSPQSILNVTPRNGAGLRANGIALPVVGAPGEAHRYRVLTPSLVVLSHRSEYLTSAKVPALVDRPDSEVDVTVDIRANADFVRQVQKELNRHLADCVTQKVLLPTGCPMGEQVTDRIQSAPSWSIVSYPIVSILPGATPGSWQVPETGALAHVTVKVKSIFDGTLSTIDENVPFTVSYLITFGGDGSPVITARN
jgi:hypothetical protein